MGTCGFIGSMPGSWIAVVFHSNFYVNLSNRLAGSKDHTYLKKKGKINHTGGIVFVRILTVFGIWIRLLAFAVFSPLLVQI